MARHLVSIVSQRSQLTLQILKAKLLGMCSDRSALDKGQIESCEKEHGVSV